MKREDFRYEVVTGFFLQDEADTEASTFEYTRNFGLIDSRLAQGSTVRGGSWTTFATRLKALNEAAAQETTYRLLFLGRHGEGWHNVAEARYGTPAWDAHYSKLDTHDGMRFLDAELTERGRQQAREANLTWQTMLTETSLMAPESYYCSPLDRCLETCKITFEGIRLPDTRPFRPIVKEGVREVIGEHTCDRRSNKDKIVEKYPSFEIEKGFAEEDPWWHPDQRESDDEVDVRLKRFLDSVFANDSSTIISVTAHSGAITSILRIVGHRIFPPRTGSVMPVLLKVTRIA